MKTNQKQSLHSMVTFASYLGCDFLLSPASGTEPRYSILVGASSRYFVLLSVQLSLIFSGPEHLMGERRTQAILSHPKTTEFARQNSQTITPNATAAPVHRPLCRSLARTTLTRPFVGVGSVVRAGVMRWRSSL